MALSKLINGLPNHLLDFETICEKNPSIIICFYSFVSAGSLLNAKLALCLSDFDVDVLTVDPRSLDLGIDSSLEWLVKNIQKYISRYTARLANVNSL